ncbi:MAG: hypothetical protein M9894_30955 [Planctomycetes bacterium]|nr:hypothetical protein [Planctomycetota bacterium]
MGESANLAFYAVVFAKGTVPKAKLDAALTQAVGQGSPLEAVLVQTGALGRGDCDELLRVRERLGRPCQSCDGVTYLLQDQTEANTACEYCGGRLLTREQQRAREAARAPAPPPGGAGRRPPPPPVRGRPSEATPPVGVRKGPPPPGAPDGRLAALERQVASLARELAEEREARAQMSALLNEAAAGAARAVELAARLEAASGEAGERAVGLVQERLGVDDLARLPARIAEQVAPRVLDAVRDRLGLDELADLPARVAAEARAAAAAAAEAPAPAVAVDEAALAARVAEEVRAGLPATPDVEGLLERAAAAARDALEGRLAALEGAPAGRGHADEAALIERVLEAVAARLPGADPEALAERVTRRALDAVGERLERFDPQEALDRAAAAAREVVEARASEQEAALRELVGGLEARLEGLAAPGQDEVVRAVEGALDARLAAVVAEQAGAAEERLARATSEVLEALNARVDEVAAEAARAGEVARAVVGEALERLDDPRELLARAVAQAAQAFEERLGEARASQGQPGAAEEAVRALEARLSALDDELRDGVDRLDARVAALRERSAGRSQEDARTRIDAAVAPLEARLAALEARPATSEEGAASGQAGLEARLAALEARPSRADGAAAADAASMSGEGGERGEGDVVHDVVQRAVQAVWDQLAPLDLPGLPGRVGEQVMAQVTARLDREMAGLVDTIAQEATAPVLKSIESRLERLDLKGLPGRVTRDVATQVRAALGEDDDLAEALAERVAGRLPAPEAAAGGGAPADVEQLVDRAAARALEWVEDRLTALEQAGGVELEVTRAAARAVAAQVVDEKLRELRPTAGDFDGAKTVVVDPSKSGTIAPGDAKGEPRTGVFDKKFVALAREVKGLKEAFEQLQGAAGRPPASSPELVALLASPEFKQTFDAKVKEVLNYVKSDLVPSAVKRALQQGSGA